MNLPRVVIDASVALGAILAGDGFTPFRGRDLLAPPLLWSEVASSLRERAWRGDIPAVHARTAISRLDVAPIAVHRPDGLYGEAWRIAEQLGWAKTYDAEYVALARLLGVPLLTVDARLRATAARLVEVITPADL